MMGALACAAFALTGQYMSSQLPELADEHAGMRMMFRSAHVYILLTGVSQLLLGAYWQPAPKGWRSLAQRVGSLLLLPSPALMCIAFFTEPSATSLSRPVTVWCLALVIGGTGLHLATRWKAPST